MQKYVKNDMESNSKGKDSKRGSDTRKKKTWRQDALKLCPPQMNFGVLTAN